MGYLLLPKIKRWEQVPDHNLYTLPCLNLKKLADIGSDVRFKQANSATKSALDTVLQKKRKITNLWFRFFSWQDFFW